MRTMCFDQCMSNCRVVFWTPSFSAACRMLRLNAGYTMVRLYGAPCSDGNRFAVIAR